MLNTELLQEEIQFNPFTSRLRQECLTHGSVLARMRNNLWVEIIFRPAGEEEGCGDRFRTADYGRLWDVNGASITSRDFDLVEFKTGNGDRPAQRFYLLEHGDGPNENTLHGFDTPEARDAKTIELIFGEDLANQDEAEQWDKYRADLLEKGSISFEGDPGLEWFTAFSSN